MYIANLYETPEEVKEAINKSNYELVNIIEFNKSYLIIFKKPLKRKISLNELSKYEEKLFKWNKHSKPLFGDIILWFIHTKEGREFISKISHYLEQLKES